MEPDQSTEPVSTSTIRATSAALAVVLLFSHLMASALQLPPVKAGVNYGCDKLRFVAPVPVNARVRAVVKLLAVEPASAGMLQLRWDLTIEVEGLERPALAAIWLSRIVP